MSMREAMASHLFIYIPSTICPNKGSVRDCTSARNKPLWDLRSTSVHSKWSLIEHLQLQQHSLYLVAILRYEEDLHLLSWDGIMFEFM